MPKESVLKTAAAMKAEVSPEWRDEKISIGGAKVKAGKVADTLAEDTKNLRDLEDCIG